MSLTYGLYLPQGFVQELAGSKNPTEACETLIHLAQTAEQSGYASVWLSDHLLTAPLSQEMIFECWTLAAALARETKRVRIGQLVTANSYRNPALQAKMASCLDVLSQGRFTFGIGAGWYEPDYRAYGYEFPTSSERLHQFQEAVQVILAMWTQEEATFEGTYYQIRGAINQPKGVQRPHIPLMIGGGGERLTLKLVAQYGDVCNLIADPATLQGRKLSGMSWTAGLTSSKTRPSGKALIWSLRLPARTAKPSFASRTLAWFLPSRATVTVRTRGDRTSPGVCVTSL